MTLHDPRSPFGTADKLFVQPRLKGLGELLAEAAQGEGEHVTLGEIVHRLSARGLAPLVLAMAIVNIVTIIPGSSTVMGLPLVFLGISLIIGAQTLWLPRRLREARFDRKAFRTAIGRALPYVLKLERLAHPRYWPGFDAVLYRLYGLFVLVLALMISLPVPFGNTMPAIAIVLVSLGFMARDGLWLLAGLVAAALAFGIVIGVVAAITFAGASVLGL